MSAPGLAMIAASERAWAAMETATAPRVYLDLRAHRESHAQGQTPWTPAIAVVYQVDEGIRLMNAEGAEHVFARHEACAAATRAGLTALGFELLADPRFASRTVTGALVPDDLDWKAFNTELKRRGLVLAGGQGKLTGKIFRLGHLGSVTLEEILGAMSVLEFVSIAFGRSVRPGSAVAAAQVAAMESFGLHRAGVRRGGCMRVLVAEPVAQEGVELLRARHEVDERPGLSRDELCAILPDYDALVVRSQVQVDAELIAAAPRLMVIGRAGVGVDNVDLEAATRAGIVVVNAPTGNTIAAAEHTLALLYGIARRTAAADASVRRGEWQRAQFTGLELRGRTLGIVGLGKIGQAIAVRARAMEMTVLGVDPFISAEAAANHGVELVEFEAMLARADVVTVHVPLTRATRGLIGRDAIAKLRPGAIVLNVARGGVVDEAALADALRSGHLAGAGIDVFEHEPPTGSPLLDAPNTLLTPHLGASTAEAQILVSEEVAAQVLDVLDGRSARYAVNAPLLTPETARAIAPYLPLAEILGRFFVQFSRGGVRSLTLEIAGELADYDGTPLTAAVLRGLLETSTTERVNLVNAGALAKARGITVIEHKTPDAGAFAALLTLSGETGRGTTVVAGTVAAGEPRITRLDDYRLDMAPADSMLITRHMDRPGTVGRVGGMLGEADINISAMHLARTRPREDAFMILALDDDVPEAVSEAIRQQEAVRDLWTIRLGGTR